MIKKILGTALALICTGLAIVGSAPALARDHMKQAANGVYAMNLDACPYYPSPVVCRLRSIPTTTGSAMASHMATGTKTRHQAPAGRGERLNVSVNRK
jgi:hypothetical protein